MKYTFDKETGLMKGLGMGEIIYIDSNTQETKMIILNSENSISITTFFANYLEFEQARRNAWKSSMERIGEDKYREYLTYMLLNTHNENNSVQKSIKTAAVDYIKYLTEKENNNDY